MPLLFPFIVFSPLTVSDIYGLHPNPLINSENNKGYIYITEIVENSSFWDFWSFVRETPEEAKWFFSDFLGTFYGLIYSF